MKPDIKIISLLVILFVAVYLAPEAEGGWRLRRAIRRVRIRLPRIRLRRIRLPRIRLPRIRIPRIRLPRIRLPRIRWPRIRIRLRKIRDKLCRLACPRVCRWIRVFNIWKWACHFGCRLLCRRRGKRQIGQEADNGVVDPAPKQFTEYDKNNDGAITLVEFAETLDIEAQEAQAVFNAIDEDNNGYIDDDEFNSDSNPLVKREEGDVSDVKATARALIERGLKEEDVEVNLRNGVDSRSLFNHDDNKDGELDNEELYLRSLIANGADDEEDDDDEGIDLRSLVADQADDDVDDDVDEGVDLRSLGEDQFGDGVEDNAEDDDELDLRSLGEVGVEDDDGTKLDLKALVRKLNKEITDLDADSAFGDAEEQDERSLDLTSLTENAEEKKRSVGNAG